ncbi:MAG: PQQ-binding-like beta-propeller repeat protein [Planctomycetota bacterium]|nr:PQQ-binding-like beta-propeller repeat protein [Planctomycetota bacterium]
METAKMPTVVLTTLVGTPIAALSLVYVWATSEVLVRLTTHAVSRRALLFSTCICFYLVSAVAVFAEDWPAWRHDAARTAKSSENLPDQIELLWRRQFPLLEPAWREDPRLQFDKSYEPIVQGKRLYLGCSQDDSLVALNTDTGDLLWRFFANGPIRFAPTADAERVFFVSDDGYLYCLRANDGSLLWKIRGGPGEQQAIGNERIVSRWPARGAPVLESGVVYFAAGLLPSDGAFVHAVDAKSGRPIWVNDGSGSLFVRQDHASHSFAGITPQGYLVISGDTLIVPCGRTSPAFLDKKTGRLISFSGFEPPKNSKPTRRRQAKHGWRGSWFITEDGKPGTERSGVVVRGNRLRADNLTAVDGEVTRMIAADGKVFCTTDKGQLCAFGTRTTKVRTHDPSRQPIPRTTTAVAASVAELLGTSSPSRGYCVLLGLGDRQWLHELLRQSSMFVVVFDTDGEKVRKARRELQAAKLYGGRVTVHHVSAKQAIDLVPYMASLIVSTNGDFASDMASWLLRFLRPYGGQAAVAYSAEREQRLKKVLEPVADQLRVSRHGNWSLVTRRGAPQGAQDWTHEYGDAGNTLNSGDSLVRAPLSLLWFGGESARLPYFNRASSAPSPLVAQSRMFIQGPGLLHAIDLYTGQVLWQTDLPSGRTPYKGADVVDGWRQRLGYSAVATDQAIIVATGLQFLRIRQVDGKIEAQWKLPQQEQYVKEIRVAGEILVATTPHSVQALSATTGAQLWRRQFSKDAVLGKFIWNGMEYGNLGTALGKSYVFGIYGISDAELARLERRGKPGPGQTVLIALDLSSGKPAWYRNLPENAHTCLSYSRAFDVLIQAPGYGAQSKALSERPVFAYRGETGDVLWTKQIAEPGPYIIQGRRVVTQAHRAYELLSGQPVLRRDPLTGTQVPWSFHKDYGCNYAIAAANLLTFRSGAAGYCDIATTGTGNFGGFRSGCRNSLIPAGGVIASPKFANGCSCSYPVLTSMALVPTNRSEVWSILSSPDTERPIVQLGLNFGAPGDRLASNATPWYDFPAVGGPSPKLEVALTPKQVDYYCWHSSRIGRKDNDHINTAAPWVCASGVHGVRSVDIELRSSERRTYDVRIYFAETVVSDPGRRVMNITVQGKRAIANYDIFAEVGKNVAQVKTVSGVTARGHIRIELEPVVGRTLLSGVELIAR